MEKKNKEPELRTLQAQAWKRAMSGKKPNAGTPHDWEDFEKVNENKKDEQSR